MKKVVLTLVFAMSAIVLFAQNIDIFSPKRPLNVIGINLLGDASIISLNYERLFLINLNYFLTSKLGIGVNEEFQICMSGYCDPPDRFLIVPHHITGNLGAGRHFFEFGLGGAFINGNTNQNYLVYPIIGYRIQPLNANKVNFRFFLNVPLREEGIEGLDIFFVPFGLSIGLSF